MYRVKKNLAMPGSYFIAIKNSKYISIFYYILLSSNFSQNFILEKIDFNFNLMKNVSQIFTQI